VINGKTYYQVLGVLEDAEDAVIRAAYKVLAQKYHPDKFDGDLNYATEKMQEISRAYDTLSNPERRGAYDQELKNQGRYKSDIGDEEEQIVSDDEENWKLACQFFPDLVKLASNLRVLRGALENQFKAYLLETRRYEMAERIANELQESYLTTYFGNNKDIHDFALHLLKNNRRGDALTLNRAVNVLGDSVSPLELMRYVTSKSDFRQDDFKHTRQTRSHELAKLILNSANFNDWELCAEFLSTFDIPVTIPSYTTERKGTVNIVLVGQKNRPMKVRDFIIWTKEDMARPFFETGILPRTKWAFL